MIRIGQEAIHNAVQHGRATVIGMELRFSDRSLRLRVSDDGRGFDAGAVDTGRDHYGLLSMKERAHLAGARLSIRSTPASGTIVELTADVAPTV